EDLLAIVNEKEIEVDGPSEVVEDAPKVTGKILAVTACPTGIAHTFMAAEKLSETAKAMGISIKVETNGSSGVKNRLTDAEIAEADAIIVAADTKVEMARFDGKPVIQIPVGKAIYETETILNRAISNDAPVYKHDGAKSSDEKPESQGGFYKHLMNGVSNMLPFVVGGGIL
ncbi:PTS fructose transporter subunit IIC, partial [Microvirga sp. 3-52]|nr:PTS fructose transporter subunit IIC [Microvirga sp. 3-52]